MSDDRPLAGVKILELSNMVTAALATTLLSEQGAETVKVEPPAVGDLMRHLGTSRQGVGAMFASSNRGKRSLALNLKTAEGVAIVRRLAAESDILISNYRPGVLAKLGLGSEAMRRENPGLIYLAISGFGTDGPLAGAPAFDHIIQAMTGFSDLQGRADQHQMIKTVVCDEVTAYTAAQAATAALYQRTRTGRGQHIDLSMMEASLYFLWPGAMSELTYQGEGVESRAPLSATYNTYPTADGHIVLAAFSDAHWQALFRVAGRADMIADERFATFEARARHLDHLAQFFGTAFTHLSAVDVHRQLLAADVPCGICLSLEEVIEQPQMTACGSVQAQQHPQLGPMLSPAHPARFGGRQLAAALPLGAIGSDTRQVLQELGYDAASIDALLAAQVVAEPAA